MEVLIMADNQMLKINQDILTNNLPDIAISFEDLHKSYGKKEVLKGITLQIKKGEIFGFLGKNGVGKSTTIDCLVGLKDYNSGTIKIFDLDIKKNPLEAKSLFGYVPSEPMTYELMSGYEYLQFVAAAYEMSQESFDENYQFLKEKFAIGDEDLNRRIIEYSHGMKQKVCLMASLIHNPKLWIMDEPTVGLDVMVYETLLKMMKEYSKSGNTIFVTSHNIDLVASICDRVAIINNGNIVNLIDFNKEPLKRKDLKRIFFRVYGINL